MCIRDKHYCLDNGLMDGTGARTFAPNGTTTRGMVVTILYRLAGQPAVTGGQEFDDVADGMWYTEAVNWAAANGIVDGYGDNRFCPEEPISREQLAVILYRYAQYDGQDTSAGEDTDLSAYSDADAIRAYAMDAMRWACGKGLIEGVTDTTLEPGGSAIRAQVATILMRFCEDVIQ